MRPGRRAVAAFLISLLLAGPPTAGAEGLGYRLRVESSLQSVAFRGVELDRLPVSELVADADGSLFTPDGIAVRCAPGDSMCTFYRPGTIRRGSPWVNRAVGSFWGAGPPGLRAHVDVRWAMDFRDEETWPGTDPGGQLLEAYLEYAVPIVRARAGRLQESTRFGFVGFDGARVELRWPSARLATAAYGGWGLARGTTLAVNDAALNPLDDYRPTERQTVIGGDVRFATHRFDARLLYQREVDPRTDQFVSERAAAEAAVTGPWGLLLQGGADRDLALADWGSADVRFARQDDGWLRAVGVGARRVRPHFDLWTIWGAFSPVGYDATFAEVDVAPHPALIVSGRAERWIYEETGASSPLVATESEGWRWTARGSVRLAGGWRVGSAAHQEFGAGASSRGGEGSLTRDFPRGSATLYGGWLERPLELRFDEAQVTTWGGRGTIDVTEAWSFAADVRVVEETRDRPDAAAFDWDQVRFGMRAIWKIGSGDGSVPAAVLRMPRRDGS
jgi:hypothetical protein